MRILYSVSDPLQFIEFFNRTYYFVERDFANMRDIKPIISTILTIIMTLGILTSCTVGQQVNQGEKNDGGTEGTIDVKVEDGETDKSTSDDAELLIIEQAKTELSEYLIANNSNVPEYMLYESNGRFVTIRNGEIFDVHDTFDEVWTAILEALTIAENGVDLMENGVYKSNDTNVSALPLSTFVAERLRKITDTTSITRTIQGNVCIIGDSTIAGYPNYPRLATYLNIGDEYSITDIATPADTLAGQLQKWNSIGQNKKSSFSYVFVQIGLNDLDKTVETFRSQYKSLITQIRNDSPNTTVILGTMIPCKQRLKNLYGNQWEVMYNRWQTANEDIRSGYYDCDDVAFLHTEALGEQENLRAEYDHGDGIHENAAGGKIVVYSWYLATLGNVANVLEQAPIDAENWLSNILSGNPLMHDEYLKITDSNNNLGGNLVAGVDIIYHTSDIQEIFEGNVITEITCANIGPGTIITLYSNPWSEDGTLSYVGRTVIGTIKGAENEAVAGSYVTTYTVSNPLPIKEGETLAISWSCELPAINNGAVVGYATPVKYSWKSDVYSKLLPQFQSFDFYVKKP